MIVVETSNNFFRSGIEHILSEICIGEEKRINVIDFSIKSTLGNINDDEIYVFFCKEYMLNMLKVHIFSKNTIILCHDMTVFMIKREIRKLIDFKVMNDKYIIEPFSIVEKNLLKLVLSGNSNNSTAYKLGLNNKTVSAYKLKIMRRLGVKRSRELILASGLINKTVFNKDTH